MTEANMGSRRCNKAATKEMAELLIKHGANVNAMNINNNNTVI